MPQERAERKLSAILSADVAGFSRLMGVDEADTVARLKQCRALIRQAVERFRGRVVDSPGDNVLTEFTSVVDAVECATVIQHGLREQNQGLPAGRRMELRIGINLGDIITDGAAIYGDGVNIAARVESLADPGGICLSGSAYEQVEGKLDLGFEYLGKHEVKNIRKPIPVYRVLEGGRAAGKVIYPRRRARRRRLLAALALVLVAAVATGWKLYSRLGPGFTPASLERMAFPLPDKPSIAVLPFKNMSEDPNQGYIADGLTENIITGLSNISEVFVIARNSSFVYKDRPVKVQQVSKDLGVRYVLEGSVQKSGDHLRITAQLVDATTGYHIWAEKYDRHLKHLFELQDEITFKILRVLEVKLVEGGQGGSQTTDNFQAWGYAVKGTGLFERFTPQDNQKAREYFQQAVQLDPNYAFAWTMLAWTHLLDAWIGFVDSPGDSLKKAQELTAKAATFKNPPKQLPSLQSTLDLMLGRYDQAVAEGRKAVDIAPNSALSHILLAYVLLFNGDFDEAVAMGERAVRLTPYCPNWYLAILGQAYRQAGNNALALAAYKKGLERARQDHSTGSAFLVGLADVSVEMGRLRQAKKYVAELREQEPDLRLEGFHRVYPYRDPARLEPILANLRKAGLE